MSNPLNITSLQPTKSGVEQLAAQIVQQVKDGETSPLELLVKLEAIKKACETARVNMEPEILAEIGKYGKDGANIYGAKIQPKETGVKYDYTQSAAWVALNAEYEAIGKKLADIEKIAKTLPDGADVNYSDPETGEYYGNVVKASKESKSSYSITLSN